MSDKEDDPKVVQMFGDPAVENPTEGLTDYMVVGWTDEGTLRIVPSNLTEMTLSDCIAMLATAQATLIQTQFEPVYYEE